MPSCRSCPLSPTCCCYWCNFRLRGASATVLHHLKRQDHRYRVLQQCANSIALSSLSSLQSCETAAMGSMRLLCALATAAALVAPPGRTTTRLTNNALPSDIGLEDAFDGLFDVLENAYTSGAVVDFTSRGERGGRHLCSRGPRRPGRRRGRSFGGRRRVRLPAAAQIPDDLWKLVRRQDERGHARMHLRRFTERPHGHGGADAGAAEPG